MSELYRRVPSVAAWNPHTYEYDEQAGHDCDLGAAARKALADWDEDDIIEALESIAARGDA